MVFFGVFGLFPRFLCEEHGRPKKEAAAWRLAAKWMHARRSGAPPPLPNWHGLQSDGPPMAWVPGNGPPPRRVNDVYGTSRSGISTTTAKSEKKVERPFENICFCMGIEGLAQKKGRLIGKGSAEKRKEKVGKEASESESFLFASKSVGRRAGARRFMLFWLF